jgi:cystathionine beta-synthase
MTIITKEDMPNYNGLEKCEWSRNGGRSSVCPHQSFPRHRRPSGPANSVLEFIGDTPLVKLERIMKLHDLPCELYAKCEYFNAGGSVKDRIGLRMIEEAERSGKLKPGDTLIEPTSGNTGVGLCVAAAIKGYKMIITMPEKMSAEKVNMMKCLGAEIIRSPDEAAWDSPESHIGIAVRLQKEIMNSHILDQYKNPANPLAHYEGTGAEILEQLNNDVHTVVIAAGTGGTLTGIARKIKDTVPECKVVAIDPVGSILAQPDTLNDFKRLEGYQVEGIGYDFIPTVLDRSVVDEWVKIDDPEALQCARELIRYEALVCGGSSGSNLAGTLKWIKSQPRESLVGKKIVTILPDSSRNYMSKFLDDNWMMDKGFMSYNECLQSKQVWSNQRLGQVPGVMVSIQTLCENTAIGKAVDDLLSSEPEVAIVNGDNVLVGSVSEAAVLNRVAQGKVSLAAPVKSAMNKKPKTVDADCLMGHLAKMMEMHPSVIVVDEHKRPVGLVKRREVLKYVASNADAKENGKPLTQVRTT